jgi:hypothetical protein
VLFFVLLSTSKLFGAITYNDGKEHIIQSVVNEAIFVEHNDFWDKTTSLIVQNSGVINGQVIAYDDSYFKMRDNAYVQGFVGKDDSKSDIYNGELNFRLEDHSCLNFWGGQALSNVEIFDVSNFSMYGGAINGHLYIYNSRDTNVFGGTLEGYLYSKGSSEVEIYGGIFNDELIAGFDSTITIYGYDFEVDGWAAPYGIYESFLGDAILTGILANGDSVNTTIQIRDDAQLILAPIPEPATLLLLGLGGLALIRKHRAK